MNKNWLRQAKEAEAIMEIFNNSFIQELNAAGYSVTQIHDEIIISKEKENKAVKITSYWQTETGHWDKEQNRYNHRRLTDIKEKELEVIIKSSAKKEKPILQFIGGPTGFESYYLDTLTKSIEKSSGDGYLTICGGTINSWPRCWVKVADLLKIIDQLVTNMNDILTEKKRIK